MRKIKTLWKKIGTVWFIQDGVLKVIVDRRKVWMEQGDVYDDMDCKWVIGSGTTGDRLVVIRNKTQW